MRIRSLLLQLSAVFVLALGACSKKVDVKASVSDLEKAFPSPAAVAEAARPASSPATPTEANDLVKTALAAARANDFASGVIALEAAQRKPGLTAEQVMTAQQAMRAMSADLARRADNGDQQALAQLKAIEKTRSQ